LTTSIDVIVLFTTNQRRRLSAKCPKWTVIWEQNTSCFSSYKVRCAEYFGNYNLVPLHSSEQFRFVLTFTLKFQNTVWVITSRVKGKYSIIVEL